MSLSELTHLIFLVLNLPASRLTFCRGLLSEEVYIILKSNLHHLNYWQGTLCFKMCCQYNLEI